MLFASPFWLLALLPWAGLVVLLLWGRRQRVDVPFLHLWKGPLPRSTPRRAFELPPWSLITILLAMVLAILAAAGPALPDPIHGPPITIILDRGLTMSASGQEQSRLHETIDLAAPELLQALGHGPVRLLSIPSQDSILTDRSDWSSLAKSLPLTALDTRHALRAAVLQQLRDTTDPVVVLSDHPLDIADDRLIQIPPATPIANVGIVHLALRERPSPQLLLRLRNQSPRIRATIAIASDNQPPIQSTLDLPPAGQRDYFLDLPTPGRVITIDLLVNDDLPADNRAALVRQQAWPRIEAQTSLPPELQRLIETYSRLRPASEHSKRIAIVPHGNALPSDQPAIVLDSPLGPASTRPTASIVHRDHPITRSITDWSPLLRDAAFASPPTDPTWTPLLTSANQPLLAIREQPLRQAWVGFRSEAFASTPQFVILWTNLFNWLGDGAETFASEPLTPLPAPWTLTSTRTSPSLTPAPGLYHHPDGRLRALNALDTTLPTPFTTDWRSQLPQVASSSSAPTTRSLATSLLFLALLALLLSALLWPRQTQRNTPAALRFPA